MKCYCNNSKGVPCEGTTIIRDVTVGENLKADLCPSHKLVLKKKGLSGLSFHTQPVPKFQDVQGELPLQDTNVTARIAEAKAALENDPNTITMLVRRVVKYTGTTMVALSGGKEWTGTLEQFKVVANEQLAKAENYHLKGFVGRVDNILYYVGRGGKTVKVSGVTLSTAPTSSRNRK